MDSVRRAGLPLDRLAAFQCARTGGEGCEMKRKEIAPGRGDRGRKKRGGSSALCIVPSMPRNLNRSFAPAWLRPQPRGRT